MFIKEYMHPLHRNLVRSLAVRHGRARLEALLHLCIGKLNRLDEARIVEVVARVRQDLEHKGNRTRIESSHCALNTRCGGTVILIANQEQNGRGYGPVGPPYRIEFDAD